MHLFMYYTRKTKTTTKNKRKQKKLYNTIYAFIYKILSLYCHSTYNILLLFIQLYAFIYVLLYIQKTKNKKTNKKQNKQHKITLQYYLCNYSLEMMTILVLTFQTLYSRNRIILSPDYFVLSDYFVLIFVQKLQYPILHVYPTGLFCRRIE